MTEATCQWRSASDSSGWGVEFVEAGSAASSPVPFPFQEPNRHGDTGPRFLLVRAEGRGSELADRAIAVASATWHSSRVCLILDRSQLGSIDCDRLRESGINLMLDGVNASTPVADFADERIDAIRFTTDFVREAAGSLRLACVLEAMLRLSRDLGLTSFGPSRYTDGRRLPAEFCFDYIASETRQDKRPTS